MENIALWVHLGSLALAALGIFYADTLAVKWVSGKSEVLDIRHLNKAHHSVSVALILMILSGIYMFWPARYYLINDPLFLLKMLFVLVLILNSFVIGEFLHLTTRSSFRSLSHRERAPLFISGAISITCWVGAGVTALVLFYF